MRAGQRKPGGLAMIEPRALPDVFVMAVFAGCRYLGRHMVQRTGILVVLQMTCGALRAQARIDTGRGAMVAGVAGCGRVRAQ